MAPILTPDEGHDRDSHVIARAENASAFLARFIVLLSATTVRPLLLLLLLLPPVPAMDSFDLSNIDIPASGSRLLSEPTPDISSSSSRTGHGGDDLSLSELSLSDRPQSKSARRRPFSLLAQPQTPDESAVADEDAEEGEGGQDETMTQEDMEKARKAAAKTREEKLQHDLFVLKKLNSAFEVYKDALRETKSSTDVSALRVYLNLRHPDLPLRASCIALQRVAERLGQTNALLDKYVRILSKSEKITKLILDERWQGAEAVRIHPRPILLGQDAD